MEKRVKTYDLEAIKLAFSSAEKLRVTATALKDARAMGFSRQDMVDVICALEKKDFVKSMTTHANHCVWQDVYNTEFNGYLLYIKFQVDDMGYFIISFKEKSPMKCYACNKGNLTQKTKPQVFTYKGRSITLEQPGLWCDFCEEGVLSGEDIAKTEKAFDEFKSKIDGLLLPVEIRRIRKDVLHLSQEEASRIFGGGKNGFSRYERGEIKPLLAVSNLLKMFERHPEDLKYFTEQQKSA